MRRISVSLALFVFSVSACGGEEPPPLAPAPPPVESAPAPPAMPPPAETPPPKKSLGQLEQEALGTALAGLNGHDAKKFASAYAENGTIDVAGLNEVSGREAIARNMSEWFETFKDVKLGFSRVWLKGETMVLEWVINGKHHGELFGVKGTEQEIGHYGLSVVTFDQDGKVAKEDRYGELGAVMSQLGAKAKAPQIPPVPEKPEVIATKGGPEEEKNVEVAKAALGALESKKEADFLGTVTDDVEQHGLIHLDEKQKGKDGAKAFFKSFTTAFPDAKFEIRKAVGIGDYAIVESVLKATHKGKLGKIAPTKRSIAVHLADVFQIKDGKIARAWTYQNSLEMQEQLGLFQVKAGNIPASQKGLEKPDAKDANKDASKDAKK